MATCGLQAASELQTEIEWRERLMSDQRAKVPAEDHH
jgi:hypothetical protein